MFRHRIFHLFLYGLLVWGLTACGCDSEPSKEPSLRVYFFESLINIRPSYFYNEVEIVGLDTVFTLESLRLDLPINPHATEMTYIFKGNTLQDTLKFSYQMNYNLDEECGYENAVSHIKYDTTSTFRNIHFYGSYSPYAQIHF